MLHFIIGFLSGIAGGMGIGGGTVLIPFLIFFTEAAQHEAQGVNLVTFIPTALAAVIVHIKNKHIQLKTAFQLIIAGITGAILGSYLASIISAQLLKKMFGVFLLIMGLYELIRKEKSKYF